jgi:CRISPR system Cascade subunit CasA
VSASPSFDLREREWIPVRRDGEVTRVGLRELFLRAHEFEDLAVPIPPAAAGLWRILYAIAARITALDSRTPEMDVWVGLRNDTLAVGSFDPTTVETYFDRHSDRFDLFHPERPFGQDARLKQQSPKPAGVNKLVFSRPVGQNPVWFGHFTDLDPVPVPAHEAVWHLVGQLYFGAAGRCASRTVSTTSAANCNAGPLRGAVSYHPIGRTVFESLMAGLPDPNCGTGEANPETDVCFWEHPAPLDPLDLPPMPGWPGGLLTGRSRHAVLLVSDSDAQAVTDAYVTWAWRRPAWPATDPYLIHRRSKQDSWYTPFADASRALWRDLDALLLHDHADRHRPAVLNSTNDLPDEVLEVLRIRAHGFDQDRQAKDRQWFTATTPPVLTYLEEHDPAGAAAMGSARRAAEAVGDQLRRALRIAWRDVASPNSSGPAPKAPEGPWPARSAALYWPRAEQLFWARLGDQARQAEPPLPEFVQLALRVIDDTIEAQERPRVAKAAVHARAVVRTLLISKETVA